VLPNITSEVSLKEFAAAPDCPALTAEELAEINRLWENELVALLDQPYADSQNKPIPVAAPASN
jgi:hypothetical protein